MDNYEMGSVILGSIILSGLFLAVAISKLSQLREEKEEEKKYTIETKS